MERTFLQLFLVICIMVPVNGLFPFGHVKIHSKDFGVVGEYVNITCEYLDSTDQKMMINGNPVNVTKKNSSTIMYSLYSEKEQVFKVTCAPLVMKKISFGYKPDFDYSLERNVVRNILLFINSTTDDSDNYFRVICNYSKDNITWFSCNETLLNKTTYMFLAEDTLFFKFNLTSSNNYGVVTKTTTKLKETIPIRFPQLSNISFTSLPSVDPFQQSGEVMLTYSHIGMVGYTLKYELKYWSEFDEPQFGKTLYNETNIFKLEKLLPYTVYSVSARVKKDTYGLWNTPLTKKFTTDTAPSNPPKTTNGTYYLWNCTETGLGKCIIVYWEEVPRKLVNGILKGYCVQIIDENNLTDHCQNPEYLTRNSLYKEFKNLPPDKTLKFSITTINNDKRKPEATIMQVGKKVPKGPKAVYVIEIEESVYNVSWLLHPHQRINNVTVFFCRNNGISTPHLYCMDNVKWEKAANKSYLLVNDSAKPLAFAAYADTTEGLSPLTKAECIFKPGKPTKPKQPEILSSENELTVLWPEFTCESLNGIPVAYEIFYNEGQNCENGSKKEFQPIGIKPPESSSVIQSLDFETKYTVCIRAVTEKYTSLMSDAVTVQTKALPEKNNTPAIVGGLFGAFLAIGFIAFVIYCITKYQKDKNAINIELPEPNPESYSAINSSYAHEYTTIDTKEHESKLNGILNSNPYMRVELDSNSADMTGKDCDNSGNTIMSFVSPLSSANGGEHENLKEHQEVQDKNVHNDNFENPGDFNEIPENSDMKNPDNVSNFAAKGSVCALTENVEMKQEAVENLKGCHSGVVSENIDLNNMAGCPGYVIVGDHCLSTQSSANNSLDVLLPGKDSDSLGYPTNNDMPTTNTSDSSFSMFLQTPNENFEEESKDSKSYDNTGYVTAEYTKAVEDPENTVPPQYVSNGNLCPVHETPTDIPQEQNISTKRLNSIEDSKTNCSPDYVFAENLSPSHQILPI